MRDDKSSVSAGFGERLRQAFDGASNAEIARKLGLSGQSVLTKWMAGTLPTGEALLAISRIAKVDLHWLLTGEGEADLDPYRFLGETERRIIQKIADDSKRSFEETLHGLVVDALVAYGQHLFGQYRTIDPGDLEQLQLLFKLYEVEEEEQTAAKSSARPRRHAS